MKSRILLISLFCIILFSSYAFSAVITVGGPSGDYATIQEAVNAANPGDIINVTAGTFIENITVNKTLTLTGAGTNQTFVTAANSNLDAFKVTASNVNISGFNISGATGYNLAGINLINSSAANCNISQNEISGSYFGIYIGFNNTNGVFNNNNLYNNSWGIYGVKCLNSEISGNTASSNSQIGINLINGSTNNILQGNTLSNNTSGIVLRMDCSNNTLVDNTLSNNGTGLNVNIMNWGPGYSDTANIVYHNNFIGNATQVTDNNPSDNMYHSPTLLEGNYWSGYTGLDDGSGTGKHAIEGDGIGDTGIPHPGPDFDFYPYMAENGWDIIPPTEYNCGDCHYVHPHSDTAKISLDTAIHERVVRDTTYALGGCVGCHSMHGGPIFPTPEFLTSVCSACHTNSDGNHPVTTIINAGLPNGCYKTIQRAVDVTAPGKTINVLTGTYIENVTVHKRLTLIGAGTCNSFVNAFDSTDDVFEITADSVNISGFNISGATGINKAGVYVNGYSGANNINVSQNRITGNYFGIFAVNSNNGVFDNNNLYANLWGLYASPASNCIISNNTADSNTQNGITLINGSTNNILQGNTLSNNTSGIVLRMNCSNNTLADNILFNNGTGLNVNIMYSDINNTIYHNNFKGNSIQVTDYNPADNKYYNLSLLEGNYWSNYYGVDDGSGEGKHAIAGDGIGDSFVPHPGENFDLYPFIAESEWNNFPPVLDPVGNKVVDENQLLQFTVSGSDTEGGTLTFTASELPAGSVFIGNSFTWTPDYSQSGTYPVTFTVSDGSKTDSETITITVNNINREPVLDPVGNKSVNENQLLTFTLTSNDPDGDTRSYSASGLPSGTVLDSTTGIFTWTPAFNQAGTYPVTFTVSDGSLSDSESITITVQDVPQIDLIMTALSTASTQIAPGSTLTVSNTVKNQGVAASGAFTIAFHLSQDTTYGGTDDVVFTTVRNVSSLGAGASSAASTTLTIPAGTPLGNYYICAFVDKDGVISEMNEQNNTRSTSIPIEVAGADLVMTAVSSPSTGTTGTSIPVSSTVLNQGTGSISSFTIGLYLSSDAAITTSDTRIGTRNVSSLNGGAYNTASTSLLIPASLAGGTYYIGAIADYNNTRPETDETNNALAGNSIVLTSGVDAIVTYVSCPSSGFTGNSTSVTLTVKNQGVATISTTTAGIYLSTDADIRTTDTRIGTASIPSLAAGASSTVIKSAAISSTLAPGLYYIGAIADYNNARNESDETNNALAGNTINITPGGDVIVETVSGPPSGVTGTSISVTSTVKNQGVGTISTTTAGIYLSTDATITTSDTRIGTASIPSLAAGASSTVIKSFIIPSTKAAGTYYIGAIADYNNARKESDETNNALAGNTIELTKP